MATANETGAGNLEHPDSQRAEPRQPTVLLVALLGFDLAGYRLGYGGGYYDRTLATLAQKPLTIGVGYELGRLETIYPQPHDIWMPSSPKAVSYVVKPRSLTWIRELRSPQRDINQLGARKASEMCSPAF